MRGTLKSKHSTGVHSVSFVIAIGDVAKHIRRIRTLYRYLPKLPGDVVTMDAQIRHSVMNSFPKRW